MGIKVFKKKKSLSPFFILNYTFVQSGDSHSNLNIEFQSKEDAIVYCERNNYKYVIEEKHQLKLRPKSYAANYSWNKKTRTTNK